MILNDKPNCQVSRILMNPRPILSDSSENDPSIKLPIDITYHTTFQILEYQFRFWALRTYYHLFDPQKYIFSHLY
jgi:hypothetical protein